MFGEGIKYKIVILEQKYEYLIKTFDCGNEVINKFLYKASNVFLNGMGITKLIINEEETKLIGFYTLCSSAMLQTIDKYNRALPAIEIKMFAIDLEYQNIPFFKDTTDEIYVFSDAMLSDIISEISTLSEETIGIKYIILHSVPKAIKFYRRGLFIFLDEINEYLELPYDTFSDGCKDMCFIL